MCWTFNPCLVSHLLSASYECYVGQHFGYYKHFLLAKLILFNPCLMCDPLVIFYEYFAYAYKLYASVWSEKGHGCLHLFLLSNKIIHVGLFTIIIPNTCIKRAGVFNDFGKSIPLSIRKFRICFVRFLLVFDS